ncbi:MAG TPA: BrnT family toxin [Edaphobacter sp.]|nr:BrnT family toxin [Edaphobacter sp.]
MSFEWNAAKAKRNLEKHGVDFADAVDVLSDNYGITLRDTFPDEERWATLGTDAFGRLLVVVYTWRGNTIRLISARKATPRERKEYEGTR